MTSPPRIQAVLFDLDETLFDRTGSLRRFLAAQLRQYTDLPSQEIEQAIQRFITLDNRGMRPKTEVYKTLNAERTFGNRADPDAMFHDYEENCWRYAKPFKGMHQLFTTLSRLGLKTGIVSNGQTHIQLRSLLALNLDRMVDLYLISQTEDLRKPDPKIFQMAAQRLNVAPNNCIFVGDNPEADIIGAHRVGMKTIWFPNGAQWPTARTPLPDATVYSLAETTGLIKNWCKKS